MDSPDYEARDVSAIIDWVATRPGVELDAPGDPRIGMVGGSYGGGIQLVTAATDCRVDAIVPTIAWHSLVTSLDKANTVKAGWSGILSNLSASDHVDPVVQQAQRTGESTGLISPSQRNWFAARGPGPLVAHITIPTLIVQGTVDTLFTLQEGVDNYEVLRQHGVPTSMLWFCGGHGVCLTPAGDQQLSVTATIGWLNRYLKRDPSVNTGPRFHSSSIRTAPRIRRTTSRSPPEPRSRQRDTARWPCWLPAAPGRSPRPAAPGRPLAGDRPHQAGQGLGAARADGPQLPAEQGQRAVSRRDRGSGGDRKSFAHRSCLIDELEAGPGVDRRVSLQAAVQPPSRG